MLSPRPFLPRLMGIGIAVLVAFATGISSRAPRALRAWENTAGEVSSARGAAGPSRRHARRAPAVLASAIQSRFVGFRPAAECPPALRLGTRAWALADVGRDVVLLKRSLLV